MTEKYSPSVKNLGKDCLFWENGCMYPKAEIIGRTSCEGVIDDVCLLFLYNRKPKSLSKEQLDKLKHNPPSLTASFLIPPGDIKP